MLIVCPSCASRYSIDDDKIGTSGRTVRCATCRTGFFVSLADDRSDIPAAAPAQLVPTPQPSADDELSAKWLADMEMEGAPPQTAATDDDAPQPQDLDQGSLDDMFEAEMAAARREAEAGGAPQDAGVVAPITGWRRFLPDRREKPGSSEKNLQTLDHVARSGKKAARSSARPGSRLRQTSATATPSRLAMLKGPLGLGLVGVLVLAGAVMQRQTVVKLLPQSAGLFSAVGLPVNLEGMEFVDIRSTSLSEGGARFLLVEGSVRSIHGDTVQVPLIEIRLRGEDGRTLYTWTTEPPRKSLKPGEALHFRTRLATPPEAGRDVEVRFTSKVQNARTGS
ncbi:MAG: zinc-ribbon domain-containing protein [Bosea sp. (in: a-proteobacteria)]